MKDAQKPDHVSLNTLIARLREGRFVVPDFQREFEWEPSDIRDLMRSIFLDYYIGSLLLWKGKRETYSTLSCEDLYGHAGERRPEYIVLDGQQRLAAMYYAFLAPERPLPTRASRFIYYVKVDKFMAEAFDEAFAYDPITRRWSELLENTEDQYAKHIFPLTIIGASGWALSTWFQGYERYWQQRASEAGAIQDSEGQAVAATNASNAETFGEHVKGITERYQISFIELDQDLSVDKVCDIFTQINSKGHRLDVFDLMNALLKPKGVQLKQLWRTAQPRLEFVSQPKNLNVYILQVMSILRQNYCSSRYLYLLLPGEEKQIREPDGTRRMEVLIQSGTEFEQRWNAAVNALVDAINLLRHPHEFGVISAAYLPYSSILPAFAALQSHAKTLPPSRQLTAHRRIRHWYWASVFNNRYSGSVESTSARDFLDVKAWIEDDDAEPAFVLEFTNQFRSLDLRKQIKRGTSVYNGVFNLLIVCGARDWVTGRVPQYGDLDDHHIIPASWGAEHIKGGQINSILNRTPLTADTNRNVIRDRPPNEYLPEWIQANGENTVRAILESHLISPAAFAILLRVPFGPDDFEAFIAERQRTLQEAIENLLIKERIDLSPQLRELDADTEKVELALRRVVETTLNGNASQIPSHVLLKVEDRISRATKKNAAIDPERYQELSGKLEYFDLRELQDTITNKVLWTQFEARFANKEALSVKFDQLGELRNSIRHSRNVDAIIRKEGEAAILWFKQVLK